MKKNLLLIPLLSLSVSKYTAGEINWFDKEVAKIHLSKLREPIKRWSTTKFEDAVVLQVCHSKLVDMFERSIESESGQIMTQTQQKLDEPIINTCLDKLRPLDLKYCKNADFFDLLFCADPYERSCDCDRIKWMIDTYEFLRKEALHSSTKELQSKEAQETSKQENS